FLILSKITDEKLGYGDSIVMLLLAVYLGWWHLLTVMIWTFTASYIYIIINLLRKKLQKGDSLPFLPFLSIGYVGYVIGDFLL
ncbi:MAG: prepilin peptidase, partial [Eubacteriales bacterium]